MMINPNIRSVVIKNIKQMRDLNYYLNGIRDGNRFIFSESITLCKSAGDDIQGIKRGIMENADIFVINKSDGPQLPLAKQTKLLYRNAVQLLQHQVEGWKCPIFLASSTTNTGLDEIYKSILKYKQTLTSLNLFLKNRSDQNIRWFQQKTKESIERIVLNNSKISNTYAKLINKIEANSLSAPGALAAMEVHIKSLFH